MVDFPTVRQKCLNVIQTENEFVLTKAQKLVLSETGLSLYISAEQLRAPSGNFFTGTLTLQCALFLLIASCADRLLKEIVMNASMTFWFSKKCS